MPFPHFSTIVHYNGVTCFIISHIIFTFHRFWVVLHNNNKIVRFLHKDHKENNRAKIRKNCETKGNMGGNKKRFELASFSDWKKNNEVWEILQEGGLSVFMERLYSKDPTITKHFIKNWKNGKVLVGSLDEEGG